MVKNSPIYSTLSVGITAGQATNPVKTDLETDTTKYILTAKLVNGPKEGNNQKQVIIWHAAAPFSIAASDAPAMLAKQARRFYLVPNMNSGGTNILKSEVSIAEGLYFYCWLEEPLLEAAAVLSLNLSEYDLL